MYLLNWDHMLPCRIRVLLPLPHDSFGEGHLIRVERNLFVRSVPGLSVSHVDGSSPGCLHL